MADRDVGAGAAQGAAAGSAFGPWGTVIGGIGGALFGGQSGGQGEATQRIEHVRPVLTPEEQALQNFFINQVYGQIGQRSPLQGLIESYYGGGGYQPMIMGQAPGYQPGVQQPMQMTPEQTRYQYEQTVKADRWGKEVFPALQKIDKLSLAVQQKPTTFAEKLKKGLTFAKGGKLAAQATGVQSIIANEKFKDIAKQLGMTPEETKKLYDEWVANPQDVAQRYVAPDQPMPAQLGPEGIQAGIQTAQPGFSSFRPETWQQPQMTMPTAPEQAETTLAQAPTQTPAQAYSPLQEVMQQSPEQLAAQYDILRQQGMRGIQDWYSQAARELEQRGIAQHGGFMGSQFERDIGGILGKRGQMETELGAQLGLSQLQAQQQMPYGQLQALEDVRRFEAGHQLAQQAPWIGVGQQMYALPWGQTTTAIKQQPGVGIIPGAIGGAYTGAGLANLLGNWRNQLMKPPATSYASTNIPATYGGSPSGYEGSMYGYGY